MAIHGLSMAENEQYILKSDPAHPDNIKAVFEKRAIDAKTQEERDEILRAVENEAGKPTIFLLGNLLHEDRVYLTDMAGGMEQTPTGSFRMIPKNNQKVTEAVRRALRGWSNFFDQNGKEIVFVTSPGTGERGQPRSFVSQDSLSALHMDIIRELSDRILEVNGVSGALEKKLQAALRQGFAMPSGDGLATGAATETSNSVGAESQASKADTGN